MNKSGLIVFVLLDMMVVVRNQIPLRPTTEAIAVRVPVDPAELQRHYRPAYGYEPYWQHGDWVFGELAAAGASGATQRELLCYNDECSFIYRRVGPVCGHRLADVRHWTAGCNLWSVAWFDCSGYNNLQFYDASYRTFPSYCDFLRYKCNNRLLVNAYVFLHVGACVPAAQQSELVYRNLSHALFAVSRKRHYVEQFRLHQRHLPTTPDSDSEYEVLTVTALP